MIYKICVIEDSPGDYNDIVETLNRFSMVMKRKAIIEVSGIKVWETELESLEDEVVDRNPNIIVLDHDLKWGTGKSMKQCNGLCVIERLGKVLNPFPYIISTSGLADQYEVLREMVSIITKIPMTRKGSTIIEKGDFIDFDSCFEMLQEALDHTRFYLPHLKIKAFPHPVTWDKKDELSGKSKNEGKRTWLFHQENIVAVVVEGNNIALFYITSDEKQATIDVMIVDGQSRKRGKKYGINDLTTDMGKSHITKFENTNTGILIHEDYAEFTVNESGTAIDDPYHLVIYRQNKMFSETMWEVFIAKLSGYVAYTERESQREGKKPEDVNPFYKKFRCFTG